MLWCLAVATGGARLWGQDVATVSGDSTVAVSGKVRKVAPDYSDLTGNASPIDLRTPDNIEYVVEYDEKGDMYMVRTRVGGRDVAVPMLLSRKEYERWQERRTIEAYRRTRNRSLRDGADSGNRVSGGGIVYHTGALDRLFGPGGLRLTARGTVQIKTGIKSMKTDNPSLSLQSRRKTYFDFDQRIQANVSARLGERLNFDLN